MRSQAEADKKQAEATQALTTATQEQRTTFNSLLTDLNKRETDLKANKLEKGSDTISLDHKLDVVATQRSNIQADVKSLDGATAASWDSLKTQFDKDVKSCRVALAPVIGKT